MIRRREFITLLGGAAVTWPVAVRAQQGERMRRIVFLHGIAENDPEAQARVVAFQQGLEAFGWVENRNTQVEHRFSGGDFAQRRLTPRRWWIRHRTLLSPAVRRSSPR